MWEETSVQTGEYVTMCARRDYVGTFVRQARNGIVACPLPEERPTRWVFILSTAAIYSAFTRVRSTRVVIDKIN